MHEGAVSSRLGMYAIPAQAEDTIIARDLQLVELTGARYHAQHLSTAGAVAMIAEAKAGGLPVTAEVTPRHLAFDESAVTSTDPAFKMMPPLRSSDDREALRRGITDGTIDVVATDHAPHAAHEKDVPFEDAPNGIIGLEWSAALLNTVVGLDPVAFFSRLSVQPALIAGLADHGRWVAVCSPARLTVFDRGRRWTAGGKNWESCTKASRRKPTQHPLTAIPCACAPPPG